PPALTDASRIQQVLENLLTNAVKFSPEGGEIAVEACRSGAEILLRVVDHGVGMATDDLERVFQPFERLEYGVRMAVPGSGLGLAIARQLIEQQGGRIWAESSVGRGTTISFTLPIAEA